MEITKSHHSTASPGGGATRSAFGTGLVEWPCTFPAEIYKSQSP